MLVNPYSVLHILLDSPVINILFSGVYIVGGKRTPFGAFGGKLKGLTPTQLQEVAAKAALQAANVKPEAVDAVIVGCVIQVRVCRLHSMAFSFLSRY